MDDIWIKSWFNHTAFDANPMWKSPTEASELQIELKIKSDKSDSQALEKLVFSLIS